MKKGPAGAGKALKTGMAGAGMAKAKVPAVGKASVKPLPGVAGTAYNKGMARMQKAQKLAGAMSGARTAKKPV